jgi:site-specific recombinase
VKVLLRNSGIRNHSGRQATIEGQRNSKGPFAMAEDFWANLWGGVVGTVVFGMIGIMLTLLALKIFDWITPRLDVQKELVEKGNIAVAIVSGALILGICHIVAVAIK